MTQTKLEKEIEQEKQKEIDYFRVMIANYSGLVATLKRIEDKLDNLMRKQND